ncbi:MAG: tRNA (adenosine(37)-N6)-dimethylallyltransferase MiaA [Candidatus Pacebacteria bacterium]|nr:tRNA (adenosine(37)-N6)-dimethylallyltransferase MiaA [Candidatus Paceibacterota bacterium]
MQENKIIVIVGPTASGKSDLAVSLAKKYNGEIISADSRQVYKGLNIGSGKITKKEMLGIKHYLLDVVRPQTIFSVSQFKKKADKVIKDILKRGKIPVLVGGTGFYISAVIDNQILPEVKANPSLRKDLALKAPSELFLRLKELDPERAKNIDVKNPHRLIRAIEIATQLGKVPSLKSLGGSTPKWRLLQIGIKTNKEELDERIEKRFHKRVKDGIIKEAIKLHKEGLTYKRMYGLGLAHKYIPSLIKKKISKQDFINNSVKEEQKYAKRQRTWFKKDLRIKWFELGDTKNINKLVSNFLEK